MWIVLLSFFLLLGLIPNYKQSEKDEAQLFWYFKAAFNFEFFVSIQVVYCDSFSTHSKEYPRYFLAYFEFTSRPD